MLQSNLPTNAGVYWQYAVLLPFNRLLCVEHRVRGSCWAHAMDSTTHDTCYESRLVMCICIVWYVCACSDTLLNFKAMHAWKVIRAWCTLTAN